MIWNVVLDNWKDYFFSVEKENSNGSSVLTVAATYKTFVVTW